MSKKLLKMIQKLPNGDIKDCVVEIFEILESQEEQIKSLFAEADEDE